LNRPSFFNFYLLLVLNPDHHLLWQLNSLTFFDNSCSSPPLISSLPMTPLLRYVDISRSPSPLCRHIPLLRQLRSYSDDSSPLMDPDLSLLVYLFHFPSTLTALLLLVRWLLPYVSSLLQSRLPSFDHRCFSDCSCFVLRSHLLSSPITLAFFTDRVFLLSIVLTFFQSLLLES
jgi:hypothetical protein